MSQEMIRISAFRGAIGPIQDSMGFLAYCSSQWAHDPKKIFTMRVKDGLFWCVLARFRGGRGRSRPFWAPTRATDPKNHAECSRSIPDAKRGQKGGKGGTSHSGAPPPNPPRPPAKFWPSRAWSGGAVNPCGARHQRGGILRISGQIASFSKTRVSL